MAIAAGLSSLVMLAVGLAAALVSLMAAFWFLSHRGPLRWLSLALFAAAPIAVIVVYALHSLLWVALVAAAGWLLAGTAARAALARDRGRERMPEYPVRGPARHPFLIMNPKSGGGKVGRFDLRRKAEELGAEVFLLSGPEPVDVAEVARRPSPTAPTCSASPAATAPRPWWPASRPSTASRSSSSPRAPATISRSTSDWTGKTR